MKKTIKKNTKGTFQMNKIAQFEKVSYEQFKKDWTKCFPSNLIKENDIKNIYNSIQIPKRTTIGSAGYDFFSSFDATVYCDGTMICDSINNMNIVCSGIITIPTGIRCQMEQGWVLQIYPRSSLGFKYGIHLANTVGIIDSDYYNSENEGHIFVKFINDSVFNKSIVLKAGQAFCQGIFVPFGVTYDDNAHDIRNGGFGSTDKV